MASGDRSSSPIVIVMGGFVVFWGCLILLFVAQTSMVLGINASQAFHGAFILWLPWIVVSPLMLLMGYALPLGGKLSARSIFGHIIACSVLVFFAGWLSRQVLPPPEEGGGQPPPFGAHAEGLPPGPGQPPFPPPGRQNDPRNDPRNGPAIGNFLRSLPVGLPLYVAAILLVGSFKLRRESSEKARIALELEAQLSDARLQALRAQLQPHFLFNTLNTLTSLVHSDPDKAEEVLLNLSSLMRATLETRDKSLIPLRQELELARDYLAIQQTRYGARLKIEEAISMETLACPVPPLILQPALENAIKHAIDPNPEGSTLRLRSERIGDKLVLEVEDSGAGWTLDAQKGHGVGVANIRARLAASFPGHATAFDLLPNPQGGITARCEMPVVAIHPEKENS
ncbi:MAG: histidine kinase [Chthoniobacterales bacterium]